MRRVLGPQLPALSHHFGIKPVDLDDMTATEIDHYLRALKTLTDKAG